MSEHQKHTEFLRRIIGYADTEEHRELEKRIVQVQREEHCVRRVIWAAAMFTLAAMVGLAYVAILEENFPYNQSQLVVKIFCDLTLASLICMAGFTVLLIVYRQRLNRLRDECRGLITRIFESCLGKSVIATRQNNPAKPADDETDRNLSEVTPSPERPRTLEMAMHDEKNHPNNLSAA